MKLVEVGSRRAMWKVGCCSAVVLIVTLAGLVELSTNQVFSEARASPQVRLITQQSDAPRPQRKISILWMGDERWEREFGGTHVVGFHEPSRPEWYWDSKVKLISYFKIDSTDNERIRARINEQQHYPAGTSYTVKNHPNNGGYWLISGHEPDITGTDPTWEEHKLTRIEQYKIIRREDPDAWNHPVFIFYNMTSTYDRAPGTYPGWEHAFTGEDHDVFLIDCYPGKEDGSLDYEEMEKAARLVKIGLSRSKGQFIANLDADYMPGNKPPNVIEQFEWWSERFDIAGVCFWHSGIGTSATGVYEDENLEEQVKEINRRLGLL